MSTTTTGMTRELLTRLRRGLGRDGVSVQVHPTGDLYLSTRYTFPDGDVLPIFLRSANGDGRVLTDQGKTIQRLSYDFKELSANLWAEIEETAHTSGLRLESGVLSLPFEPDPDLRVIQFAQGLTRIAALRVLASRSAAREAARVFGDVFREQVSRWAAEIGMPAVANYVDPERDAEGMWPVPLRVEARRPVFVFPLSTGEQCATAAATCLWHRAHAASFFSLGIFRDQDRVTGRARGRAMQVLHRTLPTMAAAREPFIETVRELVH